ncbi:MAG: methyl-accepting chemotaxis protein [Actinomycetes bacterium]
MKASWRTAALVTGFALTLTATGLLYLGVKESAQRANELDKQLSNASQNSATLLSEFFDRAVGSDVQLASEPAFARIYEKPGPLKPKIDQNLPVVQNIQKSLSAVGVVYPGAVSEACYIDIATGREIARVVEDKVAPAADLSPSEKAASFFKPSSEQPVGVPFQSTPYVSGDTNLWVVGTATPVAVNGKPRAIAHFEVSIESLREAVVAADANSHVRVVEALTGDVVIDGDVPQQPKGELGNVEDTTFQDQDVNQTGLTTVDDERVSITRMPPGRTLTATNVNNWLVTASAPTVATGVAGSFTPLIIALFALGIPLILVGLVSAFRSGRRRKAEQERVRAERDLLDARMQDLSDALARAAAGDLSVTVDVDLGDESMTALAQAFDTTLTHLRGLVTQAAASGDRLAESAAELRAAATQQAAAASEQSASVTETTATVEELAATAAQIADTASVVAQSAQETLSLTGDGLAAVQDSVTAIGRITDTVDSISTSSSALGEKVSEIGRILVLIDELSEQTNLLALNAAIEAARAGEHGRGFAVVAAEVRKLAERAQESTAQIQGLVTEIQAYTNTTVMASEAGAREAGRGVEVAGAASQALDRIAGMVESTTTAVAEISVATQQQRSASDQVVQAMEQVADMSQAFASGSQQTSASAAEITELAGDFSVAIAQFDLSGAEPAPERRQRAEAESAESPQSS